MFCFDIVNLISLQLSLKDILYLTSVNKDLYSMKQKLIHNRFNRKVLFEIYDYIINLFNDKTIINGLSFIYNNGKLYAGKQKIIDNKVVSSEKPKLIKNNCDIKYLLLLNSYINNPIRILYYYFNIQLTKKEIFINTDITYKDKYNNEEDTNKILIEKINIISYINNFCKEYIDVNYSNNIFNIFE